MRQQIMTLQRSVKRPHLSNSDRWFWIVLSKWWTHWKDVLLIVQPETVVKWHRQGFKFYWTWKSRRRPGRPNIWREVRDLIKQMQRDNPLWGGVRRAFMVNC